ncbi:carbohydrate ABC transporter substrate-binding protein, CUT1 family [Micromonospora echinaurantiaca]|uniref:Carbohydrate ABC transporter substrate-binding protein, CUT1 family n=1 Tax=Micromonospora echinaurantiaca TaxID=47857 RepID=A0A1C5JDB0_9ACTN|nr:extracellular solute-binding protein [Micromonospora echinaurantiaca]SCG68555.1 carbohydrate ABC transporter substrate-binding protein, CUT1 family [Micromonospora echinaurantiaca]
MAYRSLTRAAVAGLAAVALLGTTACGSGFDDNSGDTAQSSGPANLQILIGSSGDAETKAVQDAAAKWAASSGNNATVTPAQDLTQQLGQALAGGTPPDVFYVDAARFADYASVGALEPYGDKISNTDDFYQSLRSTFTYDGKLYCAPKDFSTLALQINTDLWAKAGLTDADVPTSWDQLTATARKIKAKGQVPLALGDTRDRIGAFLVQNGGWLMSADGKQPAADTPANLAALQYVKSLVAEGLARFPKQLDAGWSGEAFGKGAAVMTIEGNWIKGALKNDFPNVKYKVVELPAGPNGKGTLSFTQCWGIAAKSRYKEQAIKFVEAMTSGEQQMAFATAFGVMPSRQSVRDQYTGAFPADKPFIDGAAYAQGPVNAPKMDSVLRDLEAGLQGLANGDPKTILANFDKNAKAALGG